METYTGADCCGDAARMMRVPFGYHRKDPLYPKKVEIIHFDDEHRHTLDDFDHYPEVNQSIPTYFPKVVLSESISNINLSDLQSSFLDSKLADKILAENMKEYYLVVPTSSCKSRSERDLHVICQLLKSGITYENIKAIFLTFPCGDKYREKGQSSDRYLIHQIEAAREAIHYEESRKLTSVRITEKSNVVHF